MQEPDQSILDLPELLKRDRPTFENFIPGENLEALALLCEMAAGRGPRFLYIYGPVGSGLSHLLEAYAPGTIGARYPVPTDRRAGAEARHPLGSSFGLSPLSSMAVAARVRGRGRGRRHL